MGHYNPADDPAVINGIQEAYGFKIGDVVEFTNQYGVKFSPHKVVGFVQKVNPDWLPENTVYIDSDSPWYPVKPSSLKKITQGGINMVDPIGADEFFAIAFAKCRHTDMAGVAEDLLKVLVECAGELADSGDRYRWLRERLKGVRRMKAKVRDIRAVTL